MSDIYKIREMEELGCIQFEGSAAFVGVALHRELNGNICPGCPKNDNCAAQRTLRQRYAVAPIQVKKLPTETVREEAMRLGISISEVRRRRNAA